MTKSGSKAILNLMEPKLLLVGDQRICPQVAYVMDWQNYELVEQLTDAEPYRDYQIVVCAFKKKSKQFVKVKDKTLKIRYLDDLCRELDLQERTNPLTVTPLSTQPQSLWRRLCHRVKTGTLGLAIVRRLKRHLTFRNFKLINQLPVATLRLSEMLIKTLYSPPTKIICQRLENIGYLNFDGSFSGCCPAWLPAYGNVHDDDLDAIYNSVRARIIRLSALNGSYCLCNLSACEFAKYGEQPVIKPLQTPDYPQELVIAIDRTCNLRCPSCRREYYTELSPEEKDTAQRALQALQRSGWLAKSKLLNLAGDGEVFHSQYYRQLLLTDLKRSQIHLLTNGTLFNEHNWQLIKDKYARISVSVSLDAASAQTFNKLRGGDYQQLLQNLTLLSNLRQTGAIAFLEFRFVVQRDNYREIPAFVAFGKRFHADVLLFSRLNNWRSFTPREYRTKSLMLKNKCLARELYTVLQDPALQDPIVDLTAFQPYLANSAKRYSE